MRVAEEAALKGHRLSIPSDLMHDPSLKTSLKKFTEPLSNNIDRAREYSPGKKPSISQILSPQSVTKGKVVFSTRRRTTIPFSPGHNQKSSKNLTSVENQMNSTFMTTTSYGDTDTNKKVSKPLTKKSKLSVEEVRFNLLSPMQQKFHLL
jgi:hypothetical protein